MNHFHLPPPCPEPRKKSLKLKRPIVVKGRVLGSKHPFKTDAESQITPKKKEAFRGNLSVNSQKKRPDYSVSVFY